LAQPIAELYNDTADLVAMSSTKISRSGSSLSTDPPQQLLSAALELVLL
jgi:hypothetical protein